MSTTDLEQQIARLTAIEDIRKLKAEYCAYCDDKYNPDGLASLFVADGWWDGGPEFGRHDGREAIRAFFASVSGDILFAAHLVMNDIIDVDAAGDRARGRWRLLMPCTVTDDGGRPESRWLLSAYDEHYVRVDGRWLFESLIVESQFFASHLEGWAAQTAG
ncbi:MAG: nuclear transport factor 2 family protein [Gammaproteobacteria bacterium]